jgi:transcription antitermination factor NusG
MHTWVNKGSVPAVTAFILIDAKPVEVNGKEMRTVFPIQRKEDKTKRETHGEGEPQERHRQQR